MAKRLFAVLRSVLIGLAFLSIWLWFVPRWLARGPLHPEWNWPSLVLMTIGGVIAASCMWEFAWTGLGTPAPFDPPRRLVVRGLYRYVRNPMYVGAGLMILGLALALPAIRMQILALAAILWGAVSIFIMVYEEPALRGKFGAEYLEYCRHVRRWTPRLTPFDKDSGAAVPSPDLE